MVYGLTDQPEGPVVFDGQHDLPCLPVDEKAAPGLVVYAAEYGVPAVCELAAAAAIHAAGGDKPFVLERVAGQVVGLGVSADHEIGSAQERVALPCF